MQFVFFLKGVYRFLMRWLIRITGFEKDIKIETRHEIGSRLMWDSFYFSNFDKYGKMYPYLKWLGHLIRQDFRLSGDTLRDNYDKLIETKMWDKEKMKYWRNFYFLPEDPYIHFEDEE